jgi:hypothetical protein
MFLLKTSPLELKFVIVYAISITQKMYFLGTTNKHNPFIKYGFLNSNL